ncbi:MAG: Hpt domain-containing protein [Calditrichaeota bacterium]|nr:Hpt domain-containing protein [Calditrichota bacterium]MCB0295547.1 Hpt domain-containing protein [Calditrichota bacterium]MCB0317052.1 Hpt domain-containing protein [Calditrichota bacterium]
MKNDVLNEAELRERLDNDMTLLAELAAIFREDYPPLLAKIGNAIARRDGPALQESAHTLKGAVANFYAPLAVAAAGKLEYSGKISDFSSAGEDYARLQSCIEQVQIALARLLAE